MNKQSNPCVVSAEKIKGAVSGSLLATRDGSVRPCRPPIARNSGPREVGSAACQPCGCWSRVVNSLEHVAQDGVSNVPGEFAAAEEPCLVTIRSCA
jgi:hypothetical protein